MKPLLAILILTAFAFFPLETAMAQTGSTLSLTSTAFEYGQSIPPVYTCEGKDISPPLQWKNVPSGTRSFVLIADDPDAPDPAAPKMTWVHWVLYNLPPTTTSLEENNRKLPPGTHEGLNDWKEKGYRGPCPPVGTHRYFFKLYALDTVLPAIAEATKAKVEEAMQGHVLAHAQWMGTYRKK